MCSCCLCSLWAQFISHRRGPRPVAGFVLIVVTSSLVSVGGDVAEYKCCIGVGTWLGTRGTCGGWEPGGRVVAGNQGKFSLN